FNWMMWLTAGITFFCGFAVSVLPILIALGFFLGGKEVAVNEAAPAAKQPESASSADADDDDAFEDDDDDDLYEDDDDDADFDAFEDDDF
ncbi:MAG: hypothetical protein AB8G99_03215, partial [Planctomycetaceae bacterium]